MNKKIVWAIPVIMLAAFLIHCFRGSSTIGEDAIPGEDAPILVKTIDIDLTQEDYGIGVDLDKPELLEEVNAFLKEIKDNGALDEIIAHYLGDGEPVMVVPSEPDEDRDQLIVSSTLDFEPFEYGEIGEYYGIDMEIASLLADYLDKDLVIVNSNFETMFMSVRQHKCDICIGGISIDDSRRKYMNFSDPYFHVAQCLVVRGDNSEFDTCKTKEDVEKILRSKTRDVAVGVENSTTAQLYCEGNDNDGYPGLPMTVKRYKNPNVAIEAMLDGEVDYVVEDSVSAGFSVKMFNGIGGN